MTTHFCSMDLPYDLKIKSGTEGQYSLLVECQLFKNRCVKITLYGHILNYHDLSIIKFSHDLKRKDKLKKNYSLENKFIPV